MKFTNLEVLGIIVISLAAISVSELRSPIFMGLAASIAMGITYQLMPKFVQGLICKFRFVVDISLAFIVPIWFGNFTVTAVIGGVVNSILFSIFLKEEAEKFDRQAKKPVKKVKHA